MHSLGGVGCNRLASFAWGCILMRSDRQQSESPAATGLYAEQTKTINRQILAPDESAVNSTGHTFDRGEFRVLRDRFEKRGYSLQRVHRAGDGHIGYHIMHRSKTCALSHPHDVRAFLSVVEGLL